MARRTRRSLLSLLGAAALAGCSGLGGDADSSAEESADTGAERPDWIEMELRDARTDEKFRIAEYGERYVLVDSFAMWCPVCTEQQREFEAVLAERPDEVAAVSLNTDPNEGVSGVRDYVERHDFDWPFAVAQPSVTSALVDEFTEVVVNAPAAPVILVCPNGDRRLLERGVKSADTLFDATQTC